MHGLHSKLLCLSTVSEQQQWDTSLKQNVSVYRTWQICDVLQYRPLALGAKSKRLFGNELTKDPKFEGSNPAPVACTIKVVIVNLQS